MNYYLEEFMVDTTRELSKEEAIDWIKKDWSDSNYDEIWDAWIIETGRYCVTCLSKVK